MQNPKARMTPLLTQEQFEEVYATGQQALIYFTADWCGACKRIDWEFLMEEFPELPVYLCDIDVNKYTPGFCGVRSIPNFMLVTGPSKAAGPHQSSDTAKVATWITITTVKSKN